MRVVVGVRACDVLRWRSPLAVRRLHVILFKGEGVGGSGRGRQHTGYGSYSVRVSILHAMSTLFSIRMDGFVSNRSSWSPFVFRGEISGERDRTPDFLGGRWQFNVGCMQGSALWGWGNISYTTWVRTGPVAVPPPTGDTYPSAPVGFWSEAFRTQKQTDANDRNRSHVCLRRGWLQRHDV
jgi:hypothetical protein